MAFPSKIKNGKVRKPVQTSANQHKLHFSIPLKEKLIFSKENGFFIKNQKLENGKPGQTSTKYIFSNSLERAIVILRRKMAFPSKIKNGKMIKPTQTSTKFDF